MFWSAVRAEYMEWDRDSSKTKGIGKIRIKKKKRLECFRFN